MRYRVLERDDVAVVAQVFLVDDVQFLPLGEKLSELVDHVEAFGERGGFRGVSLFQCSIVFDDLLLDFLGGVREVCRLVGTFGRFSLLLCGVLEAFAELPVVAA